MDFLLMQLADSAFPAGGFAHSGGLEASVSLGHVPDASALERYCVESVWSLVHGPVPLAASAHEAPTEVRGVDQRTDAMLLSPVQNRASRVQGRALAATAEAIFPGVAPALGTLLGTHMHHAPVWGVLTRALDFSLDDARAALAFGQLRAVLSAAVRLGVVGPHEAGRQLASLGPLVTQALAQTRALRAKDASVASPLLELYASKHDSLYSRLFQS